jgi:general secretion pathway protein J
MYFWRRSPHHEEGCTLIELLIGVAIMGLLMTVIVMTFAGTFGAIEALNDERESIRQARLSLAVMTEELMMARMYQAFPFTGRGDMVAFVSAARHPYSSETSLQSGSLRVVYARDGDRLVRFALHNLYATGLESIERTELASGIVELTMRYYDGKSAAWLGEWNGPARKGFPRAVMITLVVADPQGEPRTFSNVVVVPAEPSRAGE